jgi:hypothetical protein
MTDKRFESKYTTEPNSGCWLWMGHINAAGYGQYWFDRKMEYAHRAAYKILVGSIPDDLELDHLCRIRSCVNPLHLEAVTRAVNVRRSTVGEKNRQKTHCLRGHPFSGENLAIRPNGSRRCRACHKLHKRGKRAAKQEAML